MTYIYFSVLVLIPIFVFSASPRSNFWYRLGRLFLAVISCWVLLNVVYHVKDSIDWDNYHECRANSKERIDSPEMQDECGHHINIADGGSIVFLAFIVWIPLTVITGFFELIWRLYYFKTIRQMGKQFSGRWFSNLFILFFILFILLGARSFVLAFLYSWSTLKDLI